MNMCAIVTKGSSGSTLTRIDAAARLMDPSVDCLYVDIQPMHSRLPGRVALDESLKITHVDPAFFGLSTLTRNSRINLIVSGGVAAANRMIDRAREFLKEHDIKALLLCNDRLFTEYAFVQAAKQLGIPTIFIQEGPFCIIKYIDPTHHWTKIRHNANTWAARLGFIPKIEPYGLNGHTAVLCVSESYRGRWIAGGADPSSIYVVGAPRFDDLATLDHVTLPTTRRVLFLSQPFAADRKVTEAASRAVQKLTADAFNAAYALDPFELTLRIHPRAKKETMRPLLDALQIPYEIDPSEKPLERVLFNFNCVVGHYSTGLIEALIMGRSICVVPVETEGFRLADEADKQLWFEDLGAPIARDPETGGAALQAALGGAEPTFDKQRLESECGVTDGRATERAASVVLDILRARGA
ncbi:hypothetical protein [Xanthobacter pseudotagetidis]|uniref:hypothetical protein n=1 Tax=Xanthobacter pseudotagetidis TaxID=3119911 RepID=UPI00372B2597